MKISVLGPMVPQAFGVFNNTLTVEEIPLYLAPSVSSLLTLNCRIRLRWSLIFFNRGELIGSTFEAITAMAGEYQQ